MSFATIAFDLDGTLVDTAPDLIETLNDLLVDNTAKHDPAFFEELLALEVELCDREPFNRIGFAWQLVVER